MTTIYILGDSTSMTIGMEQEMYPYHMANTACWPENTRFLNGSQPGILSADACAYFFKYLKEGPKPDGVVIYLGNCDAMESEVHKGRFSRGRELKQSLARLVGKKPKRTKMRNRLTPFAWNDQIDRSIERPEEPDDFYYNLKRVVTACDTLSVPVVLVRPKANRHFPAGLGKGNLAFYRYLGLDDRFGRVLSGKPDLVQAIKLQETGEHEEALVLFKELMSSLTMNDGTEYPLLLASNYILSAVALGRDEEAELLFEVLERQGGVRKEVVLYNKAMYWRAKGDEEKYEQFLDQAYEADSSMYRVRAPYIEAIDRIAQKFEQTVQVVDMHTLIADELYVDHCHPLPSGQEDLAQAVVAAFAKAGVKGASPADIDTVLHNPELCFGNTQEFYSYFRTYAPYSEQEIARYMATVERRLDMSPGAASDEYSIVGLPREIDWALEYYLRHPAFPTVKDALASRPSLPSDVGRFPEFHAMRHMVPYLEYIGKDEDLNQLFSGECALRSAREMIRALPAPVRDKVQSEVPSLSVEISEGLVERILAAVKAKLLKHLKGGNQIHDRIKSTIYWYFREAIRFGPHSRISMRYDRVTLEFCAEGLAVAGVLLQQNGGDLGIVREAVSALEAVVGVHDKHCVQYQPASTNEELFLEYDKQLAGCLERVQAIQTA